MTKVVNLEAYRNKVDSEKGFGAWHRRFGETYSEKTRLADLSDKTLYSLARPGEETAYAFYELILGVLGLGEAPKFFYLSNKDQMLVMDIHLFLADQVRLEMMRRLGWLTGFVGEKYTLLEMVRKAEQVKAECKGEPPRLSEARPDFEDYSRLTSGDKEMFLRRKLREALEAFHAGLAT